MKNRHFWKRGIGLLAALALLVGLLPMGALAAPGDTAEETATGSMVGTAYSEDPEAYEIYPVPHSVTYPGGEFTLTDEVNVVVGDGVDKYTTDFVRDILTRFGHTMTTSAAVVSGKSNIVLAIDSTMTEGEGHYDPYTLTAQDGTITITGMDTDCVYYGVATLQMMFTSFNGEKFLPVQIEDYSNTVFRGFIEGFYGGFDYTGRESQMRAIRDVKGNMYVFASKTDPYHGSNWSGLYPTDTEENELAKIKHLVDVGKETKVHYTWSVHIGKGHALDDIDDGATINETVYTERLNLLKAKFQQLYDVGVRSFNVLNDDYNSGTYRVQVRFLNDINAWLKELGDCMPLIYCCAGYNTAWAGNGAELEALQELNDDIYLYWTGSDVNSPITQTNVDWAATRSEQPVVTWLNYPCSEHSGGRGIFLGNISHYMKDADGLTGQYGLLSNGISSPEANKVAYFQLFSWCWNRDNYTTYLEELWEDCFKYLQPEVYESYLTIARNVSNCPDSGRIRQGFPESEYIKDALAAAQSALLAGSALADIPGAQDLLDELNNILAAVADFRANCKNTALKAELEPWLKSLTDVATAAKKGMEAADALAKDDMSGAWNAFSEGAVALGKWDTYPSSNPNVSNNVKAGSLRLQPFANAVLDYVETAMAQQFTPGGLTGGERAPIIRTAGTERPNDANAQKMFDGDLTTYASYGADQNVDDYIGVDLGAVKIVTSVDILQGQSDTHHDYFHKAAVEYSVDGENWTTLVTKVNSHHIVVEDLSVAARYVRMRLLEVGYQGPNFQHSAGANYYTYVREFTVTEKEEPLYTNADNVAAQEENNGGTYTLTVTNAALSAGDYVGIRLPELTGIQMVTTTGTLPSGVVLEWSVNGENWSQTVPTQTTLMGYVRLRATAAVTLANATLTAGGPVKTELSFVSSNIGVYDGAWANVVDGDRSTLMHTNTKQEYGQYAIFDLSGKQPIHDVTVWIPENDTDIPHNLDVFVGDAADPNGEWELIAELRDNHYDMDVPYRYFRCDGAGKLGRYIKLAIADVEAINWFKINELEVNTTVAQEKPLTAVSATSGDAADAADGDLLTFFAPDSGVNGTWTKLLQAPATLTGVTVLRGADGATAAVEVQQNGTWKKVGTLTDSATTVSLASVGAVTGVRISWTGLDVPAIAEVILSGESVPAGEPPELRPNIYERPADPEGVTVANGTALEDLPLPDKVAVTLSGGEGETSVPVAWSCENYDPATAGEYTFTGAFPETFNPGGFAVATTVTVRATEGSTTQEGDLAHERPVYASGREVASQGPEKAVNGDNGTWWSGNKMKQKDNAAKYDTITDAVSWITVDLGADVSAITQIQMLYNAKVWPLEYYVQVGGSAISYDGYTTPSIDTDNSVTDTGDVTLSSGYAGTMHALDAPGWTTIYAGTREAGDAQNPTITLGDGGDAAFTAAIPDGTRYLRLYFTQINPNALAGTGIGLKELTVTGARTVAPASPNVVSVTGADAQGTVGDTWEELDLPTRVNVTMADGTAARLAVTWDNTGYDPTLTTPQTFPGTLTLTGNQTNTGNVTATLTVTLTPAPVPVDKAALTAAITAATGAKTADGLVTKPAGTTAAQVTKGTKFVTQDAVDTLNGAIAAAQTVADKADATQAEVDGAVETLNAAVTAFNAAIQTGGKEENTPDDPVTPSKPSTSGSSSSTPATTPTTETREDGTKVTTETKPDGTKVETVEEPDGTKAVTETKKDGTVTEKVETPDGTKAVTETKPDGSKTATVEQADGTKSETVVTAEGEATITVTDPEGEEIAKVEIPATIPEPETKFEDISATPWAEEAINKVAGLELVKGVGGNKYDPVTPMTRGALATVLHRLSNGKTDYEVAFKDVKAAQYYTEGVAWAAKANVVKGISEDIFAPDQIITREQLAVMLARYAKLIGMSTKANTAALDQFTDGDATGAWAVDGMAWCVEKGILKGKGLNNLDPTADVSRAEVAVMLDRFIALIQ